MSFREESCRSIERRGGAKLDCMFSDFVNEINVRDPRARRGPFCELLKHGYRNDGAARDRSIDGSGRYLWSFKINSAPWVVPAQKKSIHPGTYCMWTGQSSLICTSLLQRDRLYWSDSRRRAPVACCEARKLHHRLSMHKHKSPKLKPKH